MNAWESLATTGLLALGLSPAWAQAGLNPKVDKLLAGAEAARKAGKPKDAERDYREALSLAEKAGGDSDSYQTALILFRDFYADAGRPGDAEALLKASLEFRKASLGPEHKTVGTALIHLGNFYDRTGKKDEAVSFYEQGLAVAEKNADHGTLSAVSKYLSNAYQSSGRVDEAEALQKKAVEAEAALRGGEGPYYASAFMDLGSYYLYSRGDAAKAEEAYRRCVTLHEAYLASGKTDQTGESVTVSNLTAVGDFHRRAKRPQEALRLYQKALATAQRRYGPDDPRVQGLKASIEAAKKMPAAPAPVKKPAQRK